MPASRKATKRQARRRRGGQLKPTLDGDTRVACKKERRKTAGPVASSPRLSSSLVLTCSSDLLQWLWKKSLAFGLGVHAKAVRRDERQRRKERRD